MELAYYLEFCKAYEYDPRAGHVYTSWKKFKDSNGTWQQKIEFAPTVDGLRLRAEKTGRYEGQVGPYWCGEDGKWSDVWLKKTPPAAAKVGVLKAGFREPLFAVAAYDSYVQTDREGKPRKNWAGMPDVMIAKAAESLALRKAFPERLAGPGNAAAEERTPHYGALEPVQVRGQLSEVSSAALAQPGKVENVSRDTGEVHDSEEDQQASYVYDTGGSHGWTKDDVDDAIELAIPGQTAGTLSPKFLQWFISKLESHSFSSFVEEARQAQAKTQSSVSESQAQAGA